MWRPFLHNGLTPSKQPEEHEMNASVENATDLGFMVALLIAAVAYVLVQLV